VGGTSNVIVYATTGEYVTGIVSASGNIISAGNVTGGNILTGGLISATGTLSVSGATTLANLSAGNISSGGISSGGAISAAGNITGGNLSGTNIVGTLTTAAQTNITSVGTLGSLAVTANVTGGNLLTGGLISATGNIRGNNISAVGDVNANNLLTPGVVSATGNVVSAGNIIASKIISATDNMVITSSGGEGGQLVMGWVGINNITGQANSTWNMDVDSGNALRVFYQSSTSATNVVLSLNSSTNVAAFSGNVSGSYFIGNGSQLTGISGGGGGSNIANGTSNVTVVSSGGNVTVGVGGTSNVAVFATTGLYVPGLISSTGNAIHSNLILNGTAAAGSGVLIVSGNIQTSTANATANIGNASNYFNRLFAQATTALYADLAEVYKADAQYPPGTVLVFGGTQEVTMSTVTHDNKIAGVVSTHPAHVMNSGLQSEFTVEVGLIGRVPCRVVGPITAGDRVVSSNRAGVAERLDMSKYQPGVIIGKAVESYSGTDVGTIEVVVGRL
jgi:hypothetical protein